MSHYKHLTLIKREKIMFLLAKGYSITAISKELNRNKSTISRELKRNIGLEIYTPFLNVNGPQSKLQED